MNRFDVSLTFKIWSVDLLSKIETHGARQDTCSC